MSKLKRDRDVVKFTTPRAVLIYPKLHAPDTKWKPEGEYGAKLRIESGADNYLINNGKTKVTQAEIERLCTEMLDRAFKKKQEELREAAADPNKKKAKKAKEMLAKLSKREDIFVPYEDDDGEETGDITFKVKMKASGVNKETGKRWERKPAVFDAKGNVLKVVPPVFGGSEAKVAVEAATYFAPNDAVMGVTFYLDGIQLLKLVRAGERSADSLGFGEEDGYEADEDEGVADEDEGGDDDSGDDADDDDEF